MPNNYILYGIDIHGKQILLFSGQLDSLKLTAQYILAKASRFDMCEIYNYYKQLVWSGTTKYQTYPVPSKLVELMETE